MTSRIDHILILFNRIVEKEALCPSRLLVSYKAIWHHKQITAVTVDAKKALRFVQH
jgi:hypothetical protein